MRTEFEFFSPVKLVTGVGASLHMEQWVKAFEADRLLVITGSHVAKSKAFQVFTNTMKEQEISYEVCSKVIPEPPVGMVDELAEYVRSKNFGLVVAVGGGSPMDTAKAICMLKNNEGSIKDYLFGGNKIPKEPSLPLICIPTTAGSGSEVTASSVIEDTDNYIKLSCTHPNLLPKIAVLDPLMQQDMPPKITAGTGMDAMTHAIEAYTSKNSSVFSDIYARRAIELIGQHLPKVMEEPDNLDSRMMMAQASSMAAIAFVNGGLGAVHGISQSMGGIAHTPHGITNAILLPKVMKYNYQGNLEKYADIAALLGVDTSQISLEEAAKAAGEKVAELNRKIGIPDNIACLNVTKDMFPEIIKGTMGYRLLWMNPVNFTEELAEKILVESLAGQEG